MPLAPDAVDASTLDELWSERGVHRLGRGTEPFNGVAVEWDQGAPALEAHYVDGYAHGVQREWHANGQLGAHTAFERGLRHGLCTTWSPEGWRSSVQVFELDVLVARTRLGPSGRVTGTYDIATDAPALATLKRLRAASGPVAAAQVARGIQMRMDLLTREERPTDLSPAAMVSEARGLAPLDARVLDELVFGWLLTHPDWWRLLVGAMGLLAGEEPRLGDVLLRLLWDLRDADDDTRGAVLRALNHALDALPRPLQDTAGWLHAPLRRGGPTFDPRRGAPCPHAADFPPLDTVAGWRARLRCLGFHPADDGPPDTWTRSCQVALVAFQLDSALPELGALDALTLATLAERALRTHRGGPAATD